MTTDNPATCAGALLVDAVAFFVLAATVRPTGLAAMIAARAHDALAAMDPPAPPEVEAALDVLVLQLMGAAVERERVCPPPPRAGTLEATPPAGSA